MSKKLTIEQFIERAKRIHGDKYDYSKIEYKDLNVKIKIMCLEHGEFWQRPNKHIYRKQGCLKCGKKSMAKKRSLGEEQFIERSKKVYGDKYDYSKVEYKNSKTKVCIICPDHGEFWQIPENHYKGHECSACAGNKKYTFDDFFKKANKIHNNKYKYNEGGYENMYKKIKIICPIHGEFNQYVYHHIYGGNGCPSCAGSNAQNELSKFVESLGIKIIKNSRSIIPPHELDIYIPEKNIAIEYNGLYWHSEQVLSKRMDFPKKYHLEKLKKCSEENIRLIQIFEDEWINKQNIVKNRLKYMLTRTSVVIGARKVIIKEIEAKEKNIFLEAHHIQGADRASVKLGAYYNNTLIGIMTFCKPRVAMGQKNAKKGVFELSRFATEFNFSFPGLASKMFQHFIRNYEVNEIFTYSDLRWNKVHGTGTVYENIGMKWIHASSPNYFYIKDERRIHRFNYRKQELPKKLKKFDPNLTEYQNMLIEGIDRCFDCGNDKFSLII